MKAKDLTQEPPRSPRVRIRDYVILARTLDKCRAAIAGNLGEYHFDCPLDNILFSFKGIRGAEFKAAVERGLDDEAVGLWVDENGIPKTPEEIRAWSDSVEKVSLYDDPEKRDFFIEECRGLGLDPKTTTLFEWLEVDDRVSYAGK